MLPEKKQPSSLAAERRLRKQRIAHLRMERSGHNVQRREQLDSSRPRIGEPATWRYGAENEYLGHQPDEFV